MASWIFIIATFISCFAFAQSNASSQVRVMVGGDIMAQARVKDSALTNGTSDQSYFGFLLEPMRSRLQAADISFANLETPISKTEIEKPRPFIFNAPQDLLSGLKWAGFDILSVINNHTLDQKMIGLEETLKAVTDEGMIALGAAENKEDALGGHISEVRGVKIGWLAATGLINGGEKEARDSLTPYLNLATRRNEILEAVRALKEKSDVILFSLHWGVEYKTVPEKWQIQFAKSLHEAGVDVLIGHHPHVLQPIRWYRRKSDGRNCLTLYSLGNLVSNQSANFDIRKPAAFEARTRDSVMVELFLTRVGVQGFRPHPLWTSNWKGKESGIQTLVINDEIERLKNELKEMKPSPYRAFLTEQRDLLTTRRTIIKKTLELK